MLLEQPRQPFYCVYSLTPIDEKQQQQQQPPPAQQLSSPLPTSGKLKPIMSNVPAQLKKQLHYQVLLKLQQSSFSSTGSVFVLPHNPPSNTPASLCFACLLSTHTDQQVAAISNGGEGFTHLVCLLIDKQTQFDAAFELYPLLTTVDYVAD
jgi:hypothetical protein